MGLAPALAPLAAFRQFVVCQIVPDPKPGAPWKTNKIPVNPRTIHAGDAQDPANWLDAAVAHNLAALLGPRFAVGFVLTAADPFFCIDLDNCLQADGTWSPVAQQLAAAFPGAAVEVSDSGRGLHIWGCGQAPAHGKKNVAYGLEFYTEKRFIALGRSGNCVGNAWTDHAAMLPTLVSTYFPPAADALPGVSDDWTTEPVAAWRGPTDDAELVRRAGRSMSAAATFGGRASFAQLYHAEVDALSKFYPSQTGGAYDGSSADMALATHLAFWTGKDMERMERIMRTSALARPKWDNRSDYYLPKTIRGACAAKVDVCTDALPAEPPPGAANTTVDAPRPTPIEGSTLLFGEAQGDLFQGCVYVAGPHKVLMPSGALLKPDQFRAHFGGYSFVMDPANTRAPSRNAWEAFTESQVQRCPRAQDLIFRPDLPPAAIIEVEGQRLVNSYWPIRVPRKPGDPQPFLDHMVKLFPDDRDRKIMLSYMAAVVQHPGVKFQWAPLIQGVEGNGKSTLSRCVAAAVGDRYTHWPKASKLGAQFNSWMTDKIFYAVEDIYTAGATNEAIIEELKPMITGENMEIERKGVDQVSRNVCGNFIFNTNHKGGLRKTKNDRRFAVFYTPQQTAADLLRDGMDGAYFKRLRDWLAADGMAIVTDLLHTMPIDPDFNPAVNSSRAPQTSTTDEAIEQGLGQIEQEVLEAVDRGDEGFRGGWISSHFFDQLLARFKKETSLPPNRRREILKTLGYDWHPGLNLGRTDNDVKPDCCRPKLFVKPDHLTTSLRGIEVARAYTRAQTVDAAVKNG